MDWASIGVCWALTTVTTIAILLIDKFIAVLRRRRRKRRSPRDVYGVTKETGKEENGQSSHLMESLPSATRACPSISSSVSSKPKSIYPNDRRKQDEVSRWCSDHGLPENLVYTLRAQGFQTKDALDALRPEDLQGNSASLQLPSTAVLVQLREVLLKIHRSSSRPESEKGDSSWKKKGVSHSISYESGRGSLANNSDVFLTALPDINELEVEPLKAEKNRSSRPSLSMTKGPSWKDSSSIPRFHGLLSDEGLWTLTKKLGHDWRHLATLLKITAKTQERLMESHRHNVESAIYEMLLMWRYEAKGTNEQMKGTLQKALVDVGRNDIANQIMHEQVHGSNDKLNIVTSII